MESITSMDCFIVINFIDVMYFMDSMDHAFHVVHGWICNGSSDFIDFLDSMDSTDSMDFAGISLQSYNKRKPFRSKAGGVINLF